MTSNLTTTDGIWTEQSPLQSNQDTNSNPAVINDNNGQSSIISTKQTATRIKEPWRPVYKLDGWSFILLYRAVTNNANRSVRYLKEGQKDEAAKAWERALIYLDELKKRNNLSDRNKAEMKQLTLKYKEHRQQMDKIKTSDSPRTKIVNTSSSIFRPTSIRECTICLESQALDQYDGNHGARCRHTRRTVCNQCVYKFSKFQLENVSKTKVTCPEPGCAQEFSYEEIHGISEIGRDKTLFDQYDLGLTLTLLKQNPEFIWCAHPGCSSGQLHDVSLSPRCAVVCIKCQRTTCSFHRMIWHTGLTCEQYDDRKVNSIRTNNWIQNNTKPCPRCQSNIEKNGGCHHMTCSRCKHQFCWECLADYNKILKQGLHQHRTTCSHYRIRQPTNPYHHRPMSPHIQRYSAYDGRPRSRTCAIL